MSDNLLSRLPGNRNVWIFVTLWLLTFVLYIPEAKSGWVIDAAGILYHAKHMRPAEFINAMYSGDQGFYQVYLLQYLIFFKLWGMNGWLWATLFITLHSVNAFMFYLTSRNILADSSIKNSIIPLAAVVIYTICPHISEVLIWRACVHYILGFMFILLIIYCVQQYQHRQLIRYPILAAIFTILCSLTHGVFLLIPFFTLTLACYYLFVPGQDKRTFKKTVAFFFMPQILVIGLYMAGLYLVFGSVRMHKTVLSESAANYLAKLPKYLFHIISFGRYFSLPAKNNVYTFLSSVPALIIFYALLAGACLYAALSFKRAALAVRVCILYFTWVIVLLVFILPVAFPSPGLLVFYDRYNYFVAPFIYLFLCLLVARYVYNKFVLIGLFCAYVDTCLFFTIKVNTLWINAETIDSRLLHNFRNDESRTVLLLNVPENMDGAAMIGAQSESMFRVMRDLYTDSIPKNKIYDVASYNMSADYDGAHVEVLNDGVIRVTLNHWGNWWWYEGHGATSYENDDYKLNMRDMGHWYDLTLKHPKDQYLLLFSVGDTWKKVDLEKMNIPQE